MTMRLREDSKTIVITDDLITDLFNGKVDPYQYLCDDDAEKIVQALNLIEDFEDLLILKDILNYDNYPSTELH